MSECLNFIRSHDCWKSGEYPDELRDPKEHEYELNAGSNAPDGTN